MLPRLLQADLSAIGARPGNSAPIAIPYSGITACRVLVLLDASRCPLDTFERAFRLIPAARSTVSLVAMVPRRPMLEGLAFSSGVCPEVLGEQGLAMLEDRLRALVTNLPRDLSVRSQVWSGTRPHRMAGRLLEEHAYDLVVMKSPGRFSYRQRALIRQVAAAGIRHRLI